MTWFNQYTAYQPCHTTTSSTTWGGWQIENQRCYGCAHSCVMYGKLVCHCVSRTITRGQNGDTCVSYKEREGAES